jgi:methyl-accepting chemotaxis protein
MGSVDSVFEKQKGNNSFENLAWNSIFKEEDISWLIDNIPVTVFRSSSKLSWGMDYLSTNVDKLTGYSKMDFINKKYPGPTLFFPRTLI